MPEADSSLRGDATYARLKQAILALELRPGERISERRLEGMLDASRTPVRATLLRLQTEDLVKREGNSWQVTPLNYDELLEAFDFRCLMEMEAVTRAIELGTRRDFDRLAAILSESEIMQPPEAFLPRTSLFHVEIARISRNRFLVRTLVEVLERLIRSRMLMLGMATTRGRAEDDHRAIAAAIRTKKADRAAKLMKAHLAWTRGLLIAGMEERRGREVFHSGGTTLR
jgi:DNA-binding GntR family transcriptional regulator